jgi:stearoyl-CoA desaturase (delta-9 desaturase)
MERILPAVIFLVVHWYASLFTQSFFNHRYAAHQMFKMSRAVEKFFFILSWIFQGSSYLSPHTYGILHRLHHAFADTANDPHSPKFDKSLWRMMWKTKEIYVGIAKHTYQVDDKYLKNLPNGGCLDAFACSWFSRILWGALYVALYVYFQVPFWLYPLLIIHFFMGPIHGAIINWFAHKVGYRNYKIADTSTNIVPVDLLMWGEALHNNHHHKGSNPNFAHRKGEFDPMYPLIWLMDKLNIISLIRR